MAAARTVLLEVVRVLGEYRSDIVLIGGWVPELLLPNAAERHVGSLDVALALNHRRFRGDGYQTVHRLLVEAGCVQDTAQPFIYRRTVQTGSASIRVQVDLLAGEYDGTTASHRTQRVQDARPRKARGCDLAFDDFVEIEVTGQLPGGAQDQAKLRVVGLGAFLVMKSMALRDRLEAKDAYDIYYCLRWAGVDAAVQALRPFVDHGLLKEAAEILAEKFASPEHVGPRDVVAFNETDDEEEKEVRARDAFERVQAVLLGIGELQAE